MHEGDWASLLTEQVRRNSRLLFGVAYRILGDAAAAEDACQAALARAWEQRHRIREPDGIAGWLVEVTVNESLQVLRRRKVEQRALRQREPGHDGQIPVVEHLARREQVVAALAQLHEPTRTVVVLRVMHGLSGNEVRAILGCSASEVSRRLHSGMDQLRAILQRMEVGLVDVSRFAFRVAS